MAPGRISIVVTGDSHLSPYLARLTPQRRAERRDRLRKAFGQAVAYAIEHGAALFVQAGDLFDTPTPANADRAYIADCLARLREKGITCVAIGGNHDTPRMQSEQEGASPLRVYEALGGLRHLSRPDALIPQLLAVNGLRLAVAGLSNHPVAPPGSDPLAGASIDDPHGVLAAADGGLLVLHAGIEGLCQPMEGERIVRRASLAALPPVFRVIVSGHIHRFAHARLNDGRDAVVCGATERMEFGAAAGSSGFAWLELDHAGLRRVEHILVPEQPRADLRITTSRLWPAAFSRHQPLRSDATLPPDADVDEAAGQHMPSDAPGPMDILRQELAAVCTPETMVRLRLAGPLTLEQYHSLALREVLLYGQRHAFSLDLDTSDLSLLGDPPSAPGQTARGGGPVSPAREVEALLAERLQTARDAAAAADAKAAAELVLARLRASVDEGAGR